MENSKETYKAAIIIVALATLGTAALATKGMKHFIKEVKKTMRAQEDKALNKHTYHEPNELEAAEDLSTAFNAVKEQRNTYLKNHEAGIATLKAASESLENTLKDKRANYEKITVISHTRNKEYVKLHHEAIIKYDSIVEPRIADISIACGYHPAGYGIIGTHSIEKLEDGSYKATWTTSYTCD